MLWLISEVGIFSTHRALEKHRRYLYSLPPWCSWPWGTPGVELLLEFCHVFSSYITHWSQGTPVSEALEPYRLTLPQKRTRNRGWIVGHLWTCLNLATSQATTAVWMDTYVPPPPFGSLFSCMSAVPWISEIFQ